MSIRSAPGGSPGWTRTGSARRSISAQIGAKAASVRLRPAMLAMTMTPTAPSSHDRASSSTARSGYSHGSDANHRIRSPMGPLRLGHRRVRFAGGLAADLLAAPVDVRAGERDDRDIDPGGVHRLRAAGRSRSDPAAGRRPGSAPRKISSRPSGRTWTPYGSPCVRRSSSQWRVNMCVWTSMIGIRRSG